MHTCVGKNIMEREKVERSGKCEKEDERNIKTGFKV
jgi:hypothetical protein